MPWEPHVVTDEVVVEAGPVKALQALFDDGLPALGIGDPLPPLWHWVALAQWAPSSAIAFDGHPHRGSFLPPVELPRRMFAGGRVSFRAPIAIGSTVRREQEVTNVAEKDGRSGKLVIVDVATRLFADGRLAVEETQSLVYRATGPGGGAHQGEDAVLAPTNTPLVRRGEWEWSLTTDPTLLMRFSAATSNAHRIHYDWPYATQVEGYPGLVVHGPLMTLALAEVVRLEAEAHISRLTHRNLAPLFCGTPATIGRVPSDDGATVQLVASDTPRTSLTYWVD